MATTAEKEALGLPSDASAEAVFAKIAELSQQAEEAKNATPADTADLNTKIAELQTENEGLVKASDELTNENEALRKQVEELGNPRGTVTPPRSDDEVPDGHVRTEVGVEPTVKKRVKILSLTWDTFEPSLLKKGEFVQKEHRHTRGEVVDVPESVAARYSQPDINAFYETIDPPTRVDDEGNLQFSQMSEADLINWHRLNNPSPVEVIDAAGGDPDVARRLVEAESVATGGDPREEVIVGLSEIIGRDS